MARLLVLTAALVAGSEMQSANGLRLRNDGDGKSNGDEVVEVVEGATEVEGQAEGQAGLHAPGTSATGEPEVVQQGKEGEPQEPAAVPPTTGDKPSEPDAVPPQADAPVQSDQEAPAEADKDDPVEADQEDQDKATTPTKPALEVTDPVPQGEGVGGEHANVEGGGVAGLGVVQGPPPVVSPPHQTKKDPSQQGEEEREEKPDETQKEEEEEESESNEDNNTPPQADEKLRGSKMTTTRKAIDFIWPLKDGGKRNGYYEDMPLRQRIGARHWIAGALSPDYHIKNYGTSKENQQMRGFPRQIIKTLFGTKYVASDNKAPTYKPVEKPEAPQEE